MRIKGELVKFSTRDGIVLEGFLQAPLRSRTCIVHVHGMESNFYQMHLPFEIAKGLNKKGIAFFSINTRGHGEVSSVRTKYGKGKRKWRAAGTRIEKFEDCIYDIDGAIEELKKLGFRKFILSGHSTGCQKVTYYQYRKNGRKISGLVLLAPADDYNDERRQLGNKFVRVVKMCKAMVRNGKGNETAKGIPEGFSARRFLSVADLKNVEARLFNYDGNLREFSKVKIPVLAVFGSREQYRLKPVKKYMQILERKTGSRMFDYAIINGARHSFEKHEDETVSAVSAFVMKIA